MIETAWSHISKAFRETAEAAVAAALAWWLSVLLIGDHVPIFAAIAAIVCLAPGLPSHSRQIVGMFAGVCIGIGAGEAAVALGLAAEPLLLGAAIFVGMMVAIAISVQPVIAIQAGASAVIVIAYGGDENSWGRFGDAAIGGAVAFLFSQVLFTPPPFEVIGKAARRLVKDARDVERELDGCCGDQGDEKDLREAMHTLRDAEQTLDQKLEHARNIARRTLRGRMHRERIEQTVEDWSELARHLHLALGSTAYALLHRDDGEGQERAGLDGAGRLLDKAERMLEDLP